MQFLACIFNTEAFRENLKWVKIFIMLKSIALEFQTHKTTCCSFDATFLLTFIIYNLQLQHNIHKFNSNM